MNRGIGRGALGRHCYVKLLLSDQNYRPNKFAQFAASCRLSTLSSFTVLTPRVEGGHGIVSERGTYT